MLLSSAQTVEGSVTPLSGVHKCVRQRLCRHLPAQYNTDGPPGRVAEWPIASVLKTDNAKAFIPSAPLLQLSCSMLECSCTKGRQRSMALTWEAAHDDGRSTATVGDDAMAGFLRVDGKDIQVGSPDELMVPPAGNLTCVYHEGAFEVIDCEHIATFRRVKSTRRQST
jgi:hypothetical protein